MIKYGLIGERLSHSYSKTIHHLLGNTEYELMELAPLEVKAFFKSPCFMGINVTIPYKQTVMPYCELSEFARKIGGVNTITNKNGTLFGHNTDYDGFSYMAERAGIRFDNKKVVILGDGATAKTARHVVCDRQAEEVVTISRKGDHNYDTIHLHYDADILVNTTPVGMFPNNQNALLDIRPFHHLEGVLDVIYNPLKTKLIIQAEELGIPCSGGLPMLVAQAVHAHDLFFSENGGNKSNHLIESILKEVERRHRNIVLIGMPGCGKTTIGKKLATDLNMAHIDTDVLIQFKAGCSPSQIITEDGEDFFRQIEEDVISDIYKQTGQVISTGGGSILRAENRINLKQNGFILFLDRPIESLATESRPLSKDADALNALFETRHPIYSSFCDANIPVEQNIEYNIEKILAIL